MGLTQPRSPRNGVLDLSAIQNRRVISQQLALASRRHRTLTTSPDGAYPVTTPIQKQPKKSQPSPICMPLTSGTHAMVISCRKVGNCMVCFVGRVAALMPATKTRGSLACLAALLQSAFNQRRVWLLM
ncbi:hypothetical protein LSTR_LSTR007255 [Laodelphax striatellus]|uniref:Uncharacterized protein n=1 Tax=Laodelphax striatellus TaxID=195883 RepID=A0A482XE39_LAOST|nr:hypothetical protein LSTR_LSTR007255 [Laodelphax striatellus]